MPRNSDTAVPAAVAYRPAFVSIGHRNGMGCNFSCMKEVAGTVGFADLVVIDFWGGEVENSSIFCGQDMVQNIARGGGMEPQGRKRRIVF
jgi:hypothetical protein